ncbi:MAG: hypothetical protein V1706_10215 [Pseudomonadota bacterium]
MDLSIATSLSSRRQPVRPVSMTRKNAITIIGDRFVLILLLIYGFISSFQDSPIYPDQPIYRLIGHQNVMCFLSLIALLCLHLYPAKIRQPIGRLFLLIFIIIVDFLRENTTEY